MSELVNVPQRVVPIAVRCDCKFKTIKGEKIQKEAKEQPLVYLTPGIDPNYIVGRCSNCGKQIIERLTPNHKKVKNVKAKKTAS